MLIRFLHTHEERYDFKLADDIEKATSRKFGHILGGGWFIVWPKRQGFGVSSTDDAIFDARELSRTELVWKSLQHLRANSVW